MNTMNTENANRFKCLIENNASQDKEKKQPERRDNYEKHEPNKKRNKFLEPKNGRFDFSHNNNNNMFKKRREGFRKHYRGREDINSFSGKYRGPDRKKEEEVPKEYCYKEEDFPSL